MVKSTVCRLRCDSNRFVHLVWDRRGGQTRSRRGAQTECEPELVGTNSPVLMRSSPQMCKGPLTKHGQSRLGNSKGPQSTPSRPPGAGIKRQMLSTSGSILTDRTHSSRHTGPRVRPLAGPRTGFGRCPFQTWSRPARLSGNPADSSTRRPRESGDPELAPGLNRGASD